MLPRDCAAILRYALQQFTTLMLMPLSQLDADADAYMMSAATAMPERCAKREYAITLLLAAPCYGDAYAAHADDAAPSFCRFSLQKHAMPCRYAAYIRLLPRCHDIAVERMPRRLIFFLPHIHCCYAQSAQPAITCAREKRAAICAARATARRAKH